MEMKSLYKNKRAFLPLLLGAPFTVLIVLLIGIIIIFVAGGALLVWLQNNLYYIIGGFLIVFGGILALKYASFNKKNTFMQYAILGFVGVGIFFILGHGVLEQYTYASILSIDQVDYDGSSLITIAGSAYGAEKLSITFGPSNLNSELDGYESTINAEGKITAFPEQLLWNVDMSNPQAVYLKKYVDLGGEITTDDAKRCQEKVPSGSIYYTHVRMGFQLVCIYDEYIRTLYKFGSTQISNSTVKFEFAGDSGYLNPASGITTLKLNSGRTTVEWTGNAKNFIEVDSPKGTYIPSYSNSVFIDLVNDDANTKVSSAKTTFDSSISNVWTRTIDTIKKATTTYNDGVNSAIVSKTSAFETSNNVDTSIMGNYYVAELSTPNDFVQFKITMDASKVGIVPLKGEPSIQECVGDINIFSSESFTASANVLNEGKSEGNFVGSVICDGSVFGYSNSVGVEKDASALISITVSGTNTKNVATSNCVFKVVDQKSQKSDECSFKVNVAERAKVVCSDYNKASCKDSKTTQTCNSDGTDYINIKTCPYVCSNGVCISEEKVDEINENINSTVPPNNGSTTDKELCLAKSAWLGPQWIESSTEECGITCSISFGLIKPKVTTSAYCKNTNLPYYIFGGLGLVFIIGIFAILLKKASGSSKRHRKYHR